MEECVMPKTTSIADEFLPKDSYDLIDRLVEQYPPRCILPNETAEDAHRYAGAAQLVNDLLEMKRNELENPLPSSTNS